MITSGRVCLVAMMIAGSCGCGTRRSELAQVEGTVRIDGRALPRGTVIFEAPGRRPAAARIENGNIIKPTTYRSGDGVPPGEHRVAVVAREETSVAVPVNPGQAAALPARAMAGRLLVPLRYTRPETSGITVTIAPGRNTVHFELSTAAP